MGDRVTAVEVLRAQLAPNYSGEDKHGLALNEAEDLVAALRAACSGGWVCIAPDGTLWEGVTLSSFAPKQDGTRNALSVRPVPCEENGR